MDQPPSASAPSERRKHWRVRLDILIYVKDVDRQREISGHSEDVGGGGARFISKFEFKPGDLVHMVIPAFMKTYQFPGEVLDSKGIEYFKEYRTRVKWIDLTPESSIIRNLLGFICTIGKK